MVSTGKRDFIYVLLTLPQAEGITDVMWGRCPDCHCILMGKNPAELVDDILGHVCEEVNVA